MATKTPLDNEETVFLRMHGREELGRLSEFEIDLLSSNGKIDFAQIVGKNMTLRVELEEGGERYFDGYVTRFSQIGTIGTFHLYAATVSPWLWFLTRTSDCRIFQKMTVPDILKKVFEDHSIAVVDYQLTATYREREYCVQYRETDFNFVSRLMEEEGIYYYFKHQSGRHTMVITDSYGGHAPFPGYANFRMFASGRGGEGLGYGDGDNARPGVHEWTSVQAVQAGQYAIDDYNFKEPRVQRRVTQTKARYNAPADYELYDYPGEYNVKSEGEHYVSARLEEVQRACELAEAKANIRYVCTGSLFTLQEHPRSDQHREYLVVGTTYDLKHPTLPKVRDALQQTLVLPEIYSDGAWACRCSFTAMYAKEQAFRPQRTTPKPIVRGPQTAVVVGPDGDEIHTDEYGRIKVQFHWDREGEKNENSSCYMRVAQVWAGNNWGATFIPRIGQEVVVSFLEGDPDQPLVTGSVYNAVQRPPYLGQGRDDKHKNDPHVSGIKTNTTKGGEGFNELRFDDTKDKEQVFIHGERNYDVRVKNDMMERVLHDRHTIIGADDKGDHLIQIHQDRHVEVKRDEIVKIGRNREELVEGDYDNIVKGTHKELVSGDQHLAVKGKKAEKVDGDVSLTVGTKLQEKVGQNAALDAGMEIHLKAGMKVIIEAGLQLSLKAGSSFIDIGPAGIAISGTPMVMINSGGAAGSGSGSSPETPQEAKEASPTEPTEADDSKSGSKSCD